MFNPVFGYRAKASRFISGTLSNSYKIQQFPYGSKVPSDEKLLNYILSEEAENESREEKPSYRKQSSLAKFQNTDSPSQTEKSDNEIPSIGPKYWKTKYRKAYRHVEKGLLSPLDQYLSKNMNAIKSYNEKKNKSFEDRLKLNYEKTLHWNDVIPNRSLYKTLIRYLYKRSPHAIENDDTVHLESLNLTSFQQRFFALMSGRVSTVAKGPSGCGKSFSLILRALGANRNHGKAVGVNSLIIVKSNELVFQYQNVINELLSEMKMNTNPSKVAQFLYRGIAEEELDQETELEVIKNPHILVSTPQRLLDIISSKGMDFLKIDNLSFVGIDDFTSMIDRKMLFETVKKSPITILMDYLMKLHDVKKKKKFYKSRPQVAIITDEAATESLIQQLKEYTNWIDWDSFAQIGKFSEDEDIPFYKYVSEKSAVSTVLTLPRALESDSKKLKISLYDMSPFTYGDSQNDWLTTLYRKSEGNEEVYQKYRNSKWSKLPLEVKKGELEILCSGLGKLLKKKNVAEWLGDKKRALVVHADEINSATVVDSLSGKTKHKVGVFNIKTDYDCFTNDVNDESEPRLYVTNISSLTGLTLRKLDTIFVLGAGSIKDVNSLSMLMGRTRGESGLIPESEYTLFSIPSGQGMDPYIPRSRTFIIMPMLPDGTVDPFERNFLERAFIVNGLVKQMSCIGIEERWTREEDAKYESAIGESYEEIDMKNDDMYARGEIQFGGLHPLETSSEGEER